MEKKVRKLIAIGFAISLSALAAAGAGAMGGGRLRAEASPYALLVQPYTVQPSVEARSADVGEFYQPAARWQTSVNKGRQSRHARHPVPLQ
jgi:hypothetical protein